MPKKDVYNRHWTEILKEIGAHYKVKQDCVLHPEVIALANYAERIADAHKGREDELDGLDLADIVACALFSATYNAHYDYDGRIEWDGEWLYQLFEDDGEIYLDVGKRDGYKPVKDWSDMN